MSRLDDRPTAGGGDPALDLRHGGPSALLDLLEALSVRFSSCTTVESLAESALDWLGGLGGGCGGAIWLHVHGGPEMPRVGLREAPGGSSWNTGVAAIHDGRQRSLVAWAMQSNDLAWFDEYGTTSAALPVLFGERVEAIVEIHWGERRIDREEVVPVLRALSMQLGPVLRRLRAERSLAASERRFLDLFESVTLGLCLSELPPGFRILSCNPAFARLLGYTTDELVGRSFLEVTHPVDRAQSVGGLDDLLDGRVPFRSMVKRYLRKDGGLVWALLTVSVYRDAQNRPLNFTAWIQDITAERRAEHELRELQMRLTDITAAEQRRIGRDLHDSVGQELTGLRYLAETLARRLGEAGRPEAERAAALVAGVQRAIGEVRAAVRGLLPIVRDVPDGLARALDALAEQTAEIYGIDCRVRHGDPADVEMSDEDIAVQLYRIAQEAVANAVKHGAPGRIEISLDGSGDAVTLAVHDDGRGLPREQPASGGMGLRTMRFRAELIGADLRIEPRAEGGTRVVCRVPRPGTEAVEDR